MKSGTDLCAVPMSPGGERRISAAGALFPRWRPDGKEIFYTQTDLRLVAALVTPKAHSLDIAEVSVLFGPSPGPVYEVSADGQRFLIARPYRASGSGRI